MNGALGQIVTVFTAITGVAILAVLVSKNAQTPQVIQSVGQAFSSSLSAATAPVTGSGGGLGVGGITPINGVGYNFSLG